MLDKEQAAKYMILAWLKDWSIRVYLETVYQNGIPVEASQIHADYPWMPAVENLYYFGKGSKYCRTFIANCYPALNNALCDAPDNKALLALAPRVLLLKSNSRQTTTLRPKDYHECKVSQSKFQANRMMTQAHKEQNAGHMRSAWGTVKGKCKP